MIEKQIAWNFYNTANVYQTPPPVFAIINTFINLFISDNREKGEES